jgi:hypothetical protein
LTIPGAGADDNPFGFTASQAVVSSVAGRAFTAPAEEEDVRVSAELDRLRKSSGWQSVSKGLNQVWLGTGLIALGFTTVGLVVALLLRTGTSVSMLVAGELPSTDGGGLQAAQLVAAGAVWGFVIAGILLRLVGFSRCLATPAEVHARFLAFLMLACEVPLLSGFALTMGRAYLPGGLALLGVVLFAAGMAAGLTFLLLYLRQIGTAMAAKPIPARVRHFVYWLGGGLIGLAVLLGLSAGMWYLGDRASPSSTWAVLALPGCCLGVFAWVGIPLTLFIKYLGTVALASDEVRKRTSRFWV